MQNNGIRINNTTDEHFNPSCIAAENYGHCTTIREHPRYTSIVVIVAIPDWWVSTNSWSKIRERDDLSSAVSGRGVTWQCQSNCMPLIDALITNLYYYTISSTMAQDLIIEQTANLLTSEVCSNKYSKASCTAYQLTQILSIHKRNTSQQTAEKQSYSSHSLVALKVQLAQLVDQSVTEWASTINGISPHQQLAIASLYYFDDLCLQQISVAVCEQ